MKVDGCEHKVCSSDLRASLEMIRWWEKDQISLRPRRKVADSRRIDIQKQGLVMRTLPWGKGFFLAS